MKDNKHYDVIIIGGSFAGLSAAMALGRSLKKTLIIDSGTPCNRYTPHSHNLITHDGSKPSTILAKALEQVLAYDTVQIISGVANSAKKVSSGFEVVTASGTLFTASKFVLATGIQDIFPDIKNFEACWGKSIIHCPYCHGYEYKGKATAILANGDRAFHLATLINNLTNKLVIITQEKHSFSAVQLEKIAHKKIQIIEQEVCAVAHSEGYINTVVFKDNSKMLFDALYVSLPFVQQSNIPSSLGCAFTDMGHIEVDAFQKTSIAGVYACGDSANPMRSVAAAIAAGGLVGAMVNNELTQERF